MGRRLDVLLGRTSRQTSKLKSLLGLTVSRIAVLRKHREVRLAHARSDVSQLLRMAAHPDRVLLRSEQVIKEQNMLDAFVIIEGYCYILSEKAKLMEPLKECPDELRETVAGLVFTASRCGDLPELQKVRYIISSRFGKEFTYAAVELRNNCRVNPKLIEYLSTRQPSLERRVRVTKEIAAENGIVIDLQDPISEFDLEVGPKLMQTKECQTLHPPNPDIDFSESARGNGFLANSKLEYEDAESAAQAAFESAAFAAAAARVAVKLSRSESQAGDGSRHGSEKRMGGHVRNFSLESESEEFKAEFSCFEFTNSPSSEDLKQNSPTQLEIVPPVSNSVSSEIIVYQRESPSAAVATINASYLNPPYEKEKAVGFDEKLRSSLDKEKDEIGLGWRNGGDDDRSSFYSDEGKARAERIQRPNVARMPTSMRTRRGF